jgi:acyl carrier protein
MDRREGVMEFVRSLSPHSNGDVLELDSLELLQVVAHIENAYGVRLDQYNVDPDDLRSIEGLKALIERLG